MPTRLARWLLFIIGLNAIAAGGCRDAGVPVPTIALVGGTATPTISSVPTPTATTTPVSGRAGTPFSRGYFLDVADPDRGALHYVSVSTLIVRGMVVEALPARWTTPDGRRPANLDEDAVPRTETIVTPFIIALDSPALVNRTSDHLNSGQVVALINGGAVGEDSLRIGLPWNHLAIGERVLITLDANPTSVNPPGPVMTSAGPGWWITMKWTLTDDCQATGGDETRDIADLEAEFRDAIRFLDPAASPTTRATPTPGAP